MPKRNCHRWITQIRVDVPSKAYQLLNKILWKLMLYTRSANIGGIRSV